MKCDCGSILVHYLHKSAYHKRACITFPNLKNVFITFVNFIVNSDKLDVNT